MRESHPSTVCKICNPRRGLPGHGCRKSLDTRIGFPRPSLNVVIDYFSHSCLKICQIDVQRTPDATFLDCLPLTFCDVITEITSGMGLSHPLGWNNISP